MSLKLFASFRRVPTGCWRAVRAVKMCPVKALNKMFEMQFQRLGGCLEAPQRNTFPVQREHQMAKWYRTKESEANRHVSPMVDT